MSDVWRNQWAVHPSLRSSLLVQWQQFQQAQRPRYETFVDLTQENKMQVGKCGNDTGEGQQVPRGWNGPEDGPVPTATLERILACEGMNLTSDAMRHLIREVLEQRANAEARNRANQARLLGFADVGSGTRKQNEAVAITSVANLLAELFQWRDLVETRVDGHRLHGTKSAVEALRRLWEDLETWRERCNWTATLGGHILWGKAAAVDHANAMAVELGEWRSGKRERSDTRNKRQQAEQVANLREVLVGLGWTPPQS